MLLRCLFHCRIHHLITLSWLTMLEKIKCCSNIQGTLKLTCSISVFSTVFGCGLFPKFKLDSFENKGRMKVLCEPFLIRLSAMLSYVLNFKSNVIMCLNKKINLLMLSHFRNITKRLTEELSFQCELTHLKHDVMLILDSVSKEINICLKREGVIKSIIKINNYFY